MTAPVPSRSPGSERPLGELAWLFLRLGTTAFGGPAAHIAMMQDEVVRRRRWLSEGEFLDLLGATNLIPGPNSTELAIHIGHRRGGWPGLLIAGTCFILPPALLVTAFAWAYVRFGSLPELEGLLYGVKPVIIAVIAQALWSLSRSAVKDRILAVLALAGILAAFAGVHELLILALGGIFAVLVQGALLRSDSAKRHVPLLAAPGALAGLTATTASGSAPFSLPALFGFFVKVGSVLFGSGYVLLAFLRAQLVDRWQWLSEQQLLDAIAVGQVTPGPVFTTATFIGYVLGGGAGAWVATVGIFLPAFFFVAISGPLIPRIRSSPTAGALLDGVNVASLALMAVVTLQLSAAALVDGPTVILAATSAVLLLKFRLNSAWIVLGGCAAGMILHRLDLAG